MMSVATIVPLLLVLMSRSSLAEVTIDLAKAVFDEELEQFCVMQKVKYSNVTVKIFYDKIFRCALPTHQKL